MQSVQREDGDCPICLTSLTGTGLVAMALVTKGELTTSERVSQDVANPRMNKQKRNREKVAKKQNGTSLSNQVPTKDPDTAKHVHHKNEDCESNTKKLGSRHTGQTVAHDCHVEARAPRSQILLSCSHIFHQCCLEAFEELAVETSRHVCPVCRSHYQKKDLKEFQQKHGAEC